MSELIISVSGLRGIVGESLTHEAVVRYALAFSAELPVGAVVVTRDGRSSGEILARFVCSALDAAGGRTVVDAGIAATPTTGVLVRQLHAVGGIQITASHNPAEYNGMKLFSSQGRVIPASDGQRVLDRYRTSPLPEVERPGESDVHPLIDTLSEHARRVLAVVNPRRIKSKGFRVLLDANHGAGSRLGQHLLEQLACRVTMLGGQPDGQFEHTPEPTAENLAGVLSKVKEAKADVGFCLDPDADRLAVIDENGRYLGEEYTLAMCVDHVLRNRASGSGGGVVTNCATSRMSQDLAEKYGVPFFRSAVGEANVVDLMLKQGALLGGEGNGGVIDPRVGLVRDSFVAMALLLDAMAARRVPISQLADELPRYEIVKTKIVAPPERIAKAADPLTRHFPEAKVDRLDGLRLDWSDRWLLLRPSNTEPIARAIAEAPTAAEAQRLCDEVARIVAAE